MVRERTARADGASGRHEQAAQEGAARAGGASGRIQHSGPLEHSSWSPADERATRSGPWARPCQEGGWPRRRRRRPLARRQPRATELAAKVRFPPRDISLLLETAGLNGKWRQCTEHTAQKRRANYKQLSYNNNKNGHNKNVQHTGFQRGGELKCTKRHRGSGFCRELRGRTVCFRCGCDR